MPIKSGDAARMAPIKRGRPVKSGDEERMAPKKRGRPVKSGDAASIAPKKRGRPRNAVDSLATASKAASKAGKSSKAINAVAAVSSTRGRPAKVTVKRGNLVDAVGKKKSTTTTVGAKGRNSVSSKAKAVKAVGKKGVGKATGKNSGKKSKKKGKKKLTEAALARSSRPKLPFRYRKAWEGNSDSDGSVDSGVLDEDICYGCGADTKDMPPELWSTLIICDICSAEYHLACAKLVKVPRNSIPFRCPKCNEEEDWFKNFSYKVDDPRFKVPKKRNTKISICYSPSKPLDLAFEECKSKGLMVVANVFPKEVMKVLTHGSLTKVTKFGRCSDSWRGAMHEVSDRLMQNVSSDVINRGGRFDMKLPDWVVDELNIPQLLQPILDRLKTIMGTPVPSIRTHNVVFAPVGSPAQAWHMDDSMQEGKRFRYFTVLIHLNPIDDECGGTEIWSKKTQRGDMIRGRPGDAFVFHGSLMHRGHCNNGYSFII